MEKEVSRKPSAVCSVSAVPTACSDANSVTSALNCAQSATAANPHATATARPRPPDQNWRGQFARGTFQNGQHSDYERVAPGTTPLQVPWPGWRTTAWHEDVKPREVRHWWGSLVDGMRDQSGQMYMRNRYYDPATGQFTQQDPIGIAGGVNTYGFANGDPVSYADPFGLCAWGIGRDTALGLCTETDRWHTAGLQEAYCVRTVKGECETYIPVDHWQRIGDLIERIPEHTDFCLGTKNALRDIWNQGSAAGRIRFWNGLDWKSNRDPQTIIGHRLTDRQGSYLAFQAEEFFVNRRLLPHEGLHLYYSIHPHPTLIGEALHRLVYRQDRVCRWR